MTKSRNLKRGGLRSPAGGRPPSAEGRLPRATITLPASHLERLRELGNGNVSAGVRRLIEEREERDRPTSDPREAGDGREQSVRG